MSAVVPNNGNCLGILPSMVRTNHGGFSKIDFELNSNGLSTQIFKLANLGSNELKQNLNSQTLGQTNLSKMSAVSTDLFVDVTFARTYLDCRLRQIKPENKCLTTMLRSMTLFS